MTDASILVAEDDKEINHLISDALKREGFFVTCAYNGMDALQFISLEEYQLIVLDLMMPGIDGYGVLGKIRSQSNTPVLILSAKSSEADKIAGLGLGADDYLTKPFSVGELIARVHAQLRRYLTYSSDRQDPLVIKYGEIELNTQTYEVNIRGRQVSLTAKEFEMLKLFMLSPQKVFTKSQLFKSIWGEEYMNDENTIMVHIHRLREKIENDPANPRLIQTVWGIGYKLACK